MKSEYLDVCGSYTLPNQKQKRTTEKNEILEFKRIIMRNNNTVPPKVSVL
jgi:hypothetical protein